MSIRSSRRVTRAALVLAVPAIALAARPAGPPPARRVTAGITYTFRMTSDMANAKPTAGKGQVAGGQARIDFEPGAQAGPRCSAGAPATLSSRTTAR